MPEWDHICSVLGIGFTGLAQGVFNSGLISDTQAVGKRYGTVYLRDLVKVNKINEIQINDFFFF